MDTKKLGIGVFGAGWVAGEHVRAFMNNPNCRIVALGSRSGDSAKALAEKHGLKVGIHTDYEKFLTSADLDVVALCTPPHLHAQEVIAAAQARKHMLIEKAVALNGADLRQMDKSVKEAGVKTVVSFVLRWNPLFQCIASLLKNNAIGRIYYADIDYWHGIGPWYRQYAWNIKKDIGVSSLLSAGCHAIDAIRFFMGLEKKVDEVFAYSTKIWREYEYDPTLAGVMKFEDGAIAKVSSCIECTTPYQFNISLLGEKGTIRDNKVYSKTLMPGQTDFAVIPTVLPISGDVTHHPFQAEIDELVQCILTGVESHASMADTVKTHEIVFALDESAATGKPIKVPRRD